MFKKACRPHEPLNKTPSKQRQMLTRSPIRTQRDCSPRMSRSPLRKKQKQVQPVYNPTYVKIGYLSGSSPKRQRTPLKNKYVVRNHDQYDPYQERHHSPYKPKSTIQNGYRKDSIRYQTEGGNHLQLFSRLADEIRKDGPGSNTKQAGSNGKLLNKDSDKKTTKIEQVKFIAINNFHNQQNVFGRLKTVKETNFSNIEEDVIQKPIQLLLRRHLSAQDEGRPKRQQLEPGDSFGHLDNVLMSFQRDQPTHDDNLLNMDPFL